MNPKDFKSNEAGECRRTVGGFWTFIPSLLPPKLVFDPPLVVALSGADAALGAVAGLTFGGAVSRMQVLIRTFSQREAVLSSRIEGTQTRLDELLLLEVSEAESDTADTREVRNYVKALESGVEAMKTRPIAARLVLELHAQLMEGVRGGDKTPGEFRKAQNFIGGVGDTPHTARYVPPPPGDLNRLLTNWEQFTNERGKLPELIQCAIMHQQFEAIHPFQDGNGRIGRLLITLFLIERHRLAQPLLYLSAFIEANRREYYDRLQAVRTDGDWRGWIMFFLAGVKQTSQQVVRQAIHLDSMRRKYRDVLRDKHHALSLLDDLFSNPYLTITRAAARLSVSKPTAQKSIDLLQKAGLLEEITGRTWGRVFVAKPILQALENPPEESAPASV